jgi:hypothetical protein
MSNLTLQLPALLMAEGHDEAHLRGTGPDAHSAWLVAWHVIPDRFILFILYKNQIVYYLVPTQPG